MQGVEEHRAGFGYAAADDHQVQIADRRDGGDHRRDGLGAATEGPQGDGIGGGGGLGQSLGVGSGPALFAGPGGEVRSTGDGLDAALSAARAGRSVHVDDDVPDVPGVAGASAVGRTVEHQAAADSGGHHHAEHERRALAGAAPVFTQCHAQSVAGQSHRHTGNHRAHPVDDGEATPGADVDRADGALGGTDRPGRGDAHPADLSPGGGQRVGDGALGGGPHLFGVGAARGGLPIGMQHNTIGVDESGGDLGAADIQRQGWPG